MKIIQAIDVSNLNFQFCLELQFKYHRRNGTEQTNDLALIESRLAIIGREKDLWSAATL